ncbi:hypothetical protein GA0070624_3329 [Micromonospora rhizosphaerae]|uniref:Uncharacterized protein n=1 Tax=Micromonospora rhizosphaerae TaxID=568872 RepID=A0A1C6SB34_9ACTN|nr:hypothetical protein GA0070624_3329 [Micromonospora rhizosphaerae]
MGYPFELAYSSRYSPYSSSYSPASSGRGLRISLMGFHASIKMAQTVWAARKAAP